MKFLFTFSLLTLVSSLTLACPNLAGRYKYERSSQDVVVVEIKQTGCELVTITRETTFATSDSVTEQTYVTDGTVHSYTKLDKTRVLRVYKYNDNTLSLRYDFPDTAEKWWGEFKYSLDRSGNLHEIQADNYHTDEQGETVLKKESI